METCLATLFSCMAMARLVPVVSVFKKFQYLQFLFFIIFLNLNILLDCLSFEWCKMEMEKDGSESAQRDCSAQSAQVSETFTKMRNQI